MPNFPNLEHALRAWVQDAVAHLSRGSEPQVWHDLHRWQRDSDGIFRTGERPVKVWNRTDLEALRQLPAWAAVEEALQGDEHLRAQLDTLVGTAKGASRFDADTAGRCVLPSPDEAADVNAAFARRYERLDRFLAAREFVYLVVWPLPGLTSTRFPIELEPDIELDAMSDDELAAALNTDVLRLLPPGAQLLFPENEPFAGLRYRYRLPKLIGDLGLAQVQASEERLNGMRDALEQVLALLFADPVAISGRVGLRRDWIPGGEGFEFLQEPLTWAEYYRKTHLDEQGATDLVETWRHLRRPGLLEKQKASRSPCAG